MKRIPNWMIVLFLLISFGAAPAYAALFSVEGTSNKGVAVSFTAQLTITDDDLEVILTNTSPTDSLNPDDLLSSFYFDIVDDSNNRPTLAYVSASGPVYQGDRDDSDTLIAANANLKAVNDGDDTWQYKPMDPSASPFLGFGIGTAGNADLPPNNFNGNIVDGIDYSIYKGEITTQNLNGELLVKETATFNFTGVAGFGEDDISPVTAFGLGTKPDSTIFTPVPPAIVLLASGLFGLGFLRRKRKR